MTTDHSNWMGELLAEFSSFGKMPVNQIAMLGAHDAATYGDYDLNHFARTQLSILLFDFVEYGGLCDALLSCYRQILS